MTYLNQNGKTLLIKDGLKNKLITTLRMTANLISKLDQQNESREIDDNLSLVSILWEDYLELSKHDLPKNDYSLLESNFLFNKFCIDCCSDCCCSDPSDQSDIVDKWVNVSINCSPSQDIISAFKLMEAVS